MYFAGPTTSAFARLYGGQVAAQCLLAAAQTVDRARVAHSIHTSFLRGGDNSKPVAYRVDRQRESKSMSTRAVTAEQDGRVLATATVSFHLIPGAGTVPTPEYDCASEQSAVEAVRAPASLPTRGESLRARFGRDVPPNGAAEWPVDLRYADRAPWLAARNHHDRNPRNRVWLRAPEYPRDLRGSDAAALTFATDLPMFEPVFFPTDIAWEDVVSGTALLGASIDHSLWFHRPARVDEWLILDLLSPIARDSRAFIRGDVRTRAGALVASVAQEVAFIAPHP